MVDTNGTCKFVYYTNGRKSKEYLIDIKRMVYSKEKETVILELNDISPQDQEFVSFRECQRGFDAIYSKILLCSNEKIVIGKT